MRSRFFTCIALLFSCGLFASVPMEEDATGIIATCGSIKPISISEVVKNSITLRPQTGIQIENFAVQQGILQELAGPFDWQVQAEYSQNNISDTFLLGFQTFLDGKELNGRYIQSKRLRIGTEFSVTAEGEKIVNPANFLLPRTSESIITFRVLQPVLRGFLYGTDAVAEAANRYELKAVYYDTLHNISDLIRQGLVAYWNVLESQQTVKALRESVSSFQYLVDKTQRLIEEDQLAKSEINNPMAQLATEQVNLKLAEQQLYTFVQALKFSMGTVNTECFSDDLLVAVTPFPVVSEPLDLCCFMSQLTANALALRLDKKAAETRICETALLVKGAQNRKLPRLDLFYEHTGTQIKTGSRARSIFSSFSYEVPQRDRALGVIFSMPLCNDEAKGIYRRFKAQWIQQRLETEELSQRVVSEVMDTWMSHTKLKQQLERAKEAVERSEQLVHDENRRLSEGIGSLFNLVEFQTRLTQARIREISVQRDLAENLTNLRFFTGTLLKEGSNFCSIGVDDVTKIPFVECSR